MKSVGSVGCCEEGKSFGVSSKLCEGFPMSRHAFFVAGGEGSRLTNRADSCCIIFLLPTPVSRQPSPCLPIERLEG